MGYANRVVDSERRERLLWELVLPVLALTPAYALAPFAPMASLGLLCLVIVPIGVVGGLLGEDRRAENRIASGWFSGDTTHADNDAKMGGKPTRLKGFASSLGLLALVSFLVIAVVFA